MAFKNDVEVLVLRCVNNVIPGYIPKGVEEVIKVWKYSAVVNITIPILILNAPVKQIIPFYSTTVKCDDGEVSVLQSSWHTTRHAWVFLLKSFVTANVVYLQFGLKCFGWINMLHQSSQRIYVLYICMKITPMCWHNAHYWSKNNNLLKYVCPLIIES